MLKMRNWLVEYTGDCDAHIGFSGEHLARRLEIEADVTDYDFKLDLAFENGKKNILDLSQEDRILYVDLERAHLQYIGRVQAQIRALRGEEVHKSNVFFLYVDSSVNAVKQFDRMEPSEFEQLEANLTAIKSEAQASARKAKESENNAKAYAEGGTVQTTTYDESGNLAGITATEVTGAKGYQSKAAENAISARKLMLRAKAYAEGGTVDQEPIGNALYPAVDTIGAKGYMEQAQEAADRAEGAAERAEAAGGSGGGGGEGTPGGYYTPTVSQPDANTMRVSYTPSQEGMAAVEQVDVVLPKGDSGKPAYESAVEAGYTGSESEFAAKLAAEHLPAPATAAVGQYFRVKALNENGLVTEVETVDAPTGGSGETWELIVDYTATADCSALYTDVDIDGKPFDLKEAIITVGILPVSGNTSKPNVTLAINNTTNGWGKGAFIMCNTPTETETKRTARTHIKRLTDGTLDVISHTVGMNNTNVCNAQILYSSNEAFSIDDDLDHKKGDITAVGIVSYLNCIGNGSRIKVIGVRK